MSSLKTKANGFSVIGILVSLGILSAAVLALTEVSRFVYASHKKNMSVTAYGDFRSLVASAISNESSWKITVQKNSEMACLLSIPINCTTAHSAFINLYDNSGNVLIDSKNEKAGLNSDFDSCDLDNKKIPCRYQAKVEWEVLCSSGTSCRHPMQKISVKLEEIASGKSEPLDEQQINHSRFSLDLYRNTESSNASPNFICAQKGNQIFIGAGKSIQGPDRMYASDSDGCIEMASLKGAVGLAGISGLQGARGAAGVAVQVCHPQQGQSCSGIYQAWGPYCGAFEHFRPQWCSISAHPWYQTGAQRSYYHGPGADGKTGTPDDVHMVSCYYVKPINGVRTCDGSCVPRILPYNTCEDWKGWIQTN